MAEWAHAYFVRRCREEGGCLGCGRGGGGGGAFISPLYLQHQGHSRTIVAADRRRDGAVRLWVVDPSKPLPGSGAGTVGGGWTSGARARRGTAAAAGATAAAAGVGGGAAAFGRLGGADARALLGRLRLAAGERGLDAPRYQLVWVEGAADRGGCVLEEAELERQKLIIDVRRGGRGGGGGAGAGGGGGDAVPSPGLLVAHPATASVRGRGRGVARRVPPPRRLAPSPPPRLVRAAYGVRPLALDSPPPRLVRAACEARPLALDSH
ncbi:hypothetical protein BU14_0235s0013 [Porphyra umbilicalis]|uniref:Uncharacterized protein n=1 Tax=Porphyra umbilicalis TaxID=2786 RepID=A0A1X6P3M4_PORUM|nr:hypothetical protein BU14_0235s0013 [Porphyra umbilicalis]|eukprot:OSX75464.1 hypothetical protein BU14_0235s0013 [Porphyra umbilicalis]